MGGIKGVGPVKCYIDSEKLQRLKAGEIIYLGSTAYVSDVYSQFHRWGDNGWLHERDHLGRMSVYYFERVLKKDYNRICKEECLAELERMPLYIFHGDILLESIVKLINKEVHDIFKNRPSVKYITLMNKHDSNSRNIYVDRSGNLHQTAHGCFNSDIAATCMHAYRLFNCRAYVFGLDECGQESVIDMNSVLLCVGQVCIDTNKSEFSQAMKLISNGYYLQRNFCRDIKGTIGKFKAEHNKYFE